jgi:hypothetical protein
MFYDQFECHQRNKKFVLSDRNANKNVALRQTLSQHTCRIRRKKEFHEKFLAAFCAGYLFCGWDKQSLFFTRRFNNFQCFPPFFMARWSAGAEI